MILKLTGDQVSAYWDLIQYSWLQTNPPPSGVSEAGYLNVLLENLLSGVAQAWLVLDETDDERSVVAIGVTQLIRDTISGIESVVIRSLFGLKPLSNELAKSCFDSFMLYARNTRAQQVKLDTSNERVKQLARLVGCEKKYETYILPLGV